jgi:hypothetical protein
MSVCSVTRSEAAKHWPEGVISVNLTMNPYLLALAFEESLKGGVKLWEFINDALWEKLGRPERDTLMEFAANMEVVEEDPKWKKRLQIAARHEVAVAACRRENMEQSDPEASPRGNGDQEPS